MRLIRETDFYETRIVSVVTSNDFFTLNLLYQPFLGTVATSLYQTLVNTNKMASKQLFSHDFLTKMLGATTLELTNALKKLEAVDLIKTYLKKEYSFNIYFYEIYSPKSAKEFFEDKIYPGLLSSIVGKQVMKNIVKRFEVQTKFDNGLEDISSSFAEVFNPSYDSGYFEQNIDTSKIGKTKNNRKVDFNVSLFAKHLLEKSLIVVEKALSQDEIEFVKNLVNIYSFDEETMAGYVGQYYDFSKQKGSRVDFDQVISELRQLNKYEIGATHKIRKPKLLEGSTDVVKLLNTMETTTTIDFLHSFMKGSKIPQTEIKLLEDLSLQFGLNNSVVNAIVYYVLQTNNASLPRALVETIAASIKRLGYETAVDCYNHFYNNTKRRGKTNLTKTSVTSEKEVNNDTNVVSQSEYSEEEVKKMLEDF